MNTIIEKIRAEIERRTNGEQGYNSEDSEFGYKSCARELLAKLSDLEKEEKPSEELEKFTEKMDAWKARFSRPDDIPVKATMAFTARMFYMYPKVAREWYESLPKATQD